VTADSQPPANPAPVAVISLYAKQPTIHSRSIAGTFNRWRWAFVWLTQAVFYGLPWLSWNQRSAVLFDLSGRRFYIFNLVLYPQDFIYLTALLALAAFSLFLFTTIAGRLWCGFACPQTVYSEVFMAIERWFEGDRIARMRLRRGPWNFNRVWREGGKHGVWLALALWTGLSFVAYFTPIRSLLASMAALSISPWEAFWVGFYGLATYGNAGFLREQVCKYMCPYARFQSAMFDKQTLIVSYDSARGEPRGIPSGRVRDAAADSRASNAAAAQPLGDCIDCSLCVQVCPTGIDIRRGLQYECIGCAACVDACDQVMDKLQRPRGLVRFATQVAPSGASAGSAWQMLRSAIVRPRVLVYGSILLGLGAAVFWGLARVVDNGQLENVYRLQLMNATEHPLQLRLKVLVPPQDSALAALAVNGTASWLLAPVEARWVTLALRLPPGTAPSAGVHAMAFELAVSAVDANTTTPPAQLIEKSTFVVPR
jgi:cytochrome c oxidase accessory protein FixG